MIQLFIITIILNNGTIPKLPVTFKAQEWMLKKLISSPISSEFAYKTSALQHCMYICFSSS